MRDEKERGGGGDGPAGAPSAATLRRDLRRVADREDTRDPPTTADYEAHGRWSRETVARRLGGDGHSWADALDAAGLDGGAARDGGGDPPPTVDDPSRADRAAADGQRPGGGDGGDGATETGADGGDGGAAAPFDGVSWVVDVEHDELPAVVPPLAPTAAPGEASPVERRPVAVLEGDDTPMAAADYRAAVRAAGGEDALGVTARPRGLYRTATNDLDCVVLDGDRAYDPPLAVSDAAAFESLCRRCGLRPRPVAVAAGGDLWSFAWVGRRHVVVTGTDPHTGAWAVREDPLPPAATGRDDGAVPLAADRDGWRCRVYEQPVSDADAAGLADALADLAV